MRQRLECFCIERCICRYLHENHNNLRQRPLWHHDSMWCACTMSRMREWGCVGQLQIPSSHVRHSYATLLSHPLPPCSKCMFKSNSDTPGSNQKGGPLKFVQVHTISAPAPQILDYAAAGHKDDTESTPKVNALSLSAMDPRPDEPRQEESAK